MKPVVACLAIFIRTAFTATPSAPAPAPTPFLLRAPAPTLDRTIVLSNPLSTVYEYDLEVPIQWTTSGNDAISKCTTVDVYLYQNPGPGASYFATLALDFPNDKSVLYLWKPSDTRDPESGLKYGTAIVGTGYSVRVQCTISDSGYSDVFDISLTSLPTYAPTPLPTPHPSPQPTPLPTAQPTRVPTPLPTALPTHSHPPTPLPTVLPSFPPTPHPTLLPSPLPTAQPTPGPTPHPTHVPTPRPTHVPSSQPSELPSEAPTALPSLTPSPAPTKTPTPHPTPPPSHGPSPLPSGAPSPLPSQTPFPQPTMTQRPSHGPTPVPTQPTNTPTQRPHKSDDTSIWVGTAAVISYVALGLVLLGALAYFLLVVRKRGRQGHAFGNEDEGIRALGGGGGGDGEEGQQRGARGNDDDDHDYGDTGPAFALADLVPGFCRRDRAVRGGRGFRGDVQADVGAFLEGDPGRGMRGSTDIHSPLVDPRLGESF